jgi:hypothetical protein
MGPLVPHSGLFDARSVIVIVCSTLALYNALELILLIFTTFQRWRGLYFWALIVASFGVIPYNVGFLVVFFQLTRQYVGFIIDSYGWITMVTGQSVVLYSRLHLVLRNPKALRAVLWMIVVDAVVFHVSTTVVLFGSSYGDDQGGFNGAWTVIEKVQMTAFCVQEFIISGLYLYETSKVLKIVSGGHTRRTMLELFIINVLIIVLDIALLVVEYLNLRVYEQAFKGVVYSIKLKLEFAILGKLVHVVRNRNRVLSNAIGDTAEFVDDTRSPSDVTHVELNPQRKSSRHFWTKEVDEACSEHIESVEKPNEIVVSVGDDHILEDGRGYRGIEEALKDQRTVDTSRRRTRTDSDLDSLYAEAMRQISR